MSCISQDKSVDHQLVLDEEEDIRETVFRYQFVRNESGISDIVETYCLALGENRDPSNDLIDRFKGSSKGVKKISQCEISNREAKKPDPVGYAIDKETGKTAIIFTIDNISWKNKKEVLLKGGYFSNSLSAETSNYVVRKEGSRWTVTKRKLLSISRSS